MAVDVVSTMSGLKSASGEENRTRIKEKISLIYDLFPERNEKNEENETNENVLVVAAPPIRDDRSDCEEPSSLTSSHERKFASEAISRATSIDVNKPIDPTGCHLTVS